MRLAYVDPHCVPDACTESLQILQTVDALGEIGVQVDLVTPRPRRKIAPADILGRALSANVTLHSLADVRKRWWFPSSSNRPFYWLARRALRRLSVDALLVRNLRMAEVLLKIPDRPPLFFETHEIFAQTFREEHPEPTRGQARKLAALDRRERLVYSKADGIVALTALLWEDVRKLHSIETPGIVASDGVDLKQAAEARPSSSEDPILLYLGSLHPWKGVEVLIEAVSILSCGVLRVAGGGESRIAELKRLARRFGVADRVAFLGMIPPRRRFDVIGASQVCLLPLTQTSIASRYTSPMKLFEYMAMGRAIVAADLPSMRAVLTHGETALLVPPGEPAAFARAIEELLANREMREAMGRRAREMAREYSWVARARTIASFIERRLSTGGQCRSNV